MFFWKMSHNIFLKVISDKGLGVSKDQSIISVRLLSQWLSSPYTKGNNQQIVHKTFQLA